MATSLENLGNEFEITNHEKTTAAEKMKVWCIWSQLWPIVYNFGYEIQNSVAMATSLLNFRKHLKLAISMPPVDAKILIM